MTPPRELEERWKTWLADRNRRGMIMVFWIVLALYPAFGILDYQLAPRAALPLLYGTRTLVVLATLAMFTGVRTAIFERQHAIISATYTVLCASGITLMTVFLGGMTSPYYAGLILVIVGSGLLFVWPASVVLATHASIIVCFIGASGTRLPCFRDILSRKIRLFSRRLRRPAKGLIGKRALVPSACLGRRYSPTLRRPGCRV